jgi:hypothetical protein
MMIVVLLIPASALLKKRRKNHHRMTLQRCEFKAVQKKSTANCAPDTSQQQEGPSFSGSSHELEKDPPKSSSLNGGEGCNPLKIKGLTAQLIRSIEIVDGCH